MRTDRASDTLDFFQGEVERLSAALADAVEEDRRVQDRERRGAARQHGQPPRPAGARGAAPPRPAARGGGAEEPARHRGLGLRAHRPRQHRGAAQPRGGGAAEPAEPAPAAAGDLQGRAARRSGCCRPGSRRSRASSPSSRRRARCPAPTARRPSRSTELEVELAPIDEQLKYIAEERASDRADARRARGLDPGDAARTRWRSPTSSASSPTCRRQYDSAVAALGQAQVGERIEVLSKGQRFTLIEAPVERNTPVSPPRLLIAGAGVFGGLGAAARLHRALGDAEPLDPPAGRALPAASASSRSPPSPTSAPRASSAGSATWSSRCWR